MRQKSQPTATLFGVSTRRSQRRLRSPSSSLSSPPASVSSQNPMWIGTQKHWSGGDVLQNSNAPQSPLHAGAVAPQGGRIVVLVVVVVVDVVTDAPPSDAGR